MQVMVPSKKLVAVAVPLCNRKELTADEQISFRHLMQYLGRYDKFLVVPKSLDITVPGSRNKEFPDHFFGSVSAHNRLMLSPQFYECFTDYKYILIYHPDALVFSDQLLEWCENDLDYIGSPWVNCPDSPWVKVPRVGNGGFSLRKVDSFLRVLHSDRYAIDTDRYWREFCQGKPRYARYLNLPRKYLKRLRMFNGARWEAARWHSRPDGTRNEDHFWSDEAIKYDPEFKVAPFETGLRFSFEVAPRLCFEMNNRQLPFGCHAWQRYDRAFWEPYLLK